MACDRCGSACQGKHCKTCEQLIAQGGRATDDVRTTGVGLEDYSCPECGGPTSGQGVVCRTCRQSVVPDGGSEYVVATDGGAVNPEAYLQEAATRLAAARKCPDLTESQRKAAGHIRGLVETLAESIVATRQLEDASEPVTDGGYPQPEIGDRVTFIDSGGHEHRAVVVDAVQDSEYISLVRSEQGQLGEDYTWSTDTETSVYPHYTEWPPGEHETHAFILGWSE